MASLTLKSCRCLRQSSSQSQNKKVERPEPSSDFQWYPVPKCAVPNVSTKVVHQVPKARARKMVIKRLKPTTKARALNLKTLSSFLSKQQLDLWRDQLTLWRRISVCGRVRQKIEQGLWFLYRPNKLNKDFCLFEEAPQNIEQALWLLKSPNLITFSYCPCPVAAARADYSFWRFPHSKSAFEDNGGFESESCPALS